MAASDPFWEAAADGRLRLQWSSSANRVVQYPRALSPYATDDELIWRDAEPIGVVLASTVVHRHSHAEFAAQTPFGLALIEVAGTARLMARFDPADTIVPGAAINVAFHGSPPVPHISLKRD